MLTIPRLVVITQRERGQERDTSKLLSDNNSPLVAYRSVDGVNSG